MIPKNEFIGTIREYVGRQIANHQKLKMGRIINISNGGKTADVQLLEENSITLNSCPLVQENYSAIGNVGVLIPYYVNDYVIVEILDYINQENFESGGLITRKGAHDLYNGVVRGRFNLTSLDITDFDNSSVIIKNNNTKIVVTDSGVLLSNASATISVSENVMITSGGSTISVSDNVTIASGGSTISIAEKIGINGGGQSLKTALDMALTALSSDPMLSGSTKAQISQAKTMLASILK
jgi:hypothetical protein